MKKEIIIILSLLLLISCTQNNDSDISDPQTNSNTEWTVNLGRDTTIPFFPDGQSNYFTYAYERTVDDNTIVEINGQFPDARYMSIIVYDNDTRNPAGIIVDEEIIPNNESVNPFQEQNYTANQDYTIFIGPNISQLGFNNALSFNSSITSISIFVRYYVPSVNDFGNVELPNISATDFSGNSIEIPEAKSLEDLVDIQNIQDNLIAIGSTLFTTEPESNRLFVRASGNTSGNFANPDNDYLIAAATLEDSEVVLLRWKAPSVAENFSDFTSTDMRYFSMCLSDESSFNYATVYDEELYVADDGFINLVIAREDSEIITQSDGLNLLIWPSELGDQGYLLYRNMVTKPGLPHAIDQCNPVAGNATEFFINPESFNAHNFIGDFAPSGKRMSKAEFLDNFGGIEVSY